MQPAVAEKSLSKSFGKDIHRAFFGCFGQKVVRCRNFDQMKCFWIKIEKSEAAVLDFDVENPKVVSENYFDVKDKHCKGSFAGFANTRFPTKTSKRKRMFTEYASE